MATSILHRASGLVLSRGIAAAGRVAGRAGLRGRNSYAAVAACLASWPGRVLLGLLLLAFCYHFCNGIRHLLWDLGVGLERSAARRSAQLVVISLALVARASVLCVALLRKRGAP